MSEAAQTVAATPAPPSRELRPAAQVRSTGWVLKRAAFGLVMLLSVSVGAAVLLDATIDSSLEQASE